MPSKCDASPLLWDQYTCFFCPGSKMHNHDIMANVLQGNSPSQSFVKSFGLHSYSLTNIISSQSLVTAYPGCIFLKMLESWHNPFTMETEWQAYGGLGLSRLVWGVFCWWAFYNHIFQMLVQFLIHTPCSCLSLYQSIIKCILELCRH